MRKSKVNGFPKEEINSKKSEIELDSDEELESDDGNMEVLEKNSQDQNSEEMVIEENDELAKESLKKKQKKRKKGIIYISNIPKHMNVTILREMLGQHGKIGRVYLQPEKPSGIIKF